MTQASTAGNALEGVAREIGELYSDPACALAASGSVDIINKAVLALDALPCKWCASPRVAGELLRLFPYAAANDCARWSCDETAHSLAICRACVGSYYRARPELTRHFSMLGEDVSLPIWKAVDDFDRQRLCIGMEAALKSGSLDSIHGDDNGSEKAKELLAQSLAEIMLWPAHLVDGRVRGLFYDCVEKLLGPALLYRTLSSSPGAALLAFSKRPKVREWALDVLALKSDGPPLDAIERSFPFDLMLASVNWDDTSDLNSLVAAAETLSCALRYGDCIQRLVKTLFARASDERASAQLRALVEFTRKSQCLETISRIAEAVFGASSIVHHHGLGMREVNELSKALIASIGVLGASDAAAASETLANVANAVAAALESTENPMRAFCGIITAEPIVECTPGLSSSHPAAALRILSVTVRRALNLIVQDEIWRPIITAMMACAFARSNDGDHVGARAHLQNLATALRAPLAPSAFLGYFTALRDVSLLLFALRLSPLVGIQIAQTVVGDDALCTGPDGPVLLIVYAALKREVDTQLQRIHSTGPVRSIETWFAACKLLRSATHTIWPHMLRLFVSTVITPASLSGGSRESASVITTESHTNFASNAPALVMAARLCFALALYAVSEAGDVAVIDPGIRVLAYAHVVITEHNALGVSIDLLEKIRVDADALDILVQKIVKHIAMNPPTASNSNEVSRALTATIDLARVQKVVFTHVTRATMSTAFSLTGVHVEPEDAVLFDRACTMYERAMGCAMLQRLTVAKSHTASPTPTAAQVALAKELFSSDAERINSSSLVKSAKPVAAMSSGQRSLPAGVSSTPSKGGNAATGLSSGVSLPTIPTARRTSSASDRSDSELLPIPRALALDEGMKFDSVRVGALRAQSRMDVVRNEALRAQGLPIPPKEEPKPSRMEQLRAQNPPQQTLPSFARASSAQHPAKVSRTISSSDVHSSDVLGPSTRSAGAITQRSRAEIESSDGEQSNPCGSLSRGVKLIEPDGITPRTIVQPRMETRMDAARVQREMALASAFHKSVLSLDLAAMAAGDDPSGNTEATRAVPDKFTTPEEYVNVFEPLLLMEARAEITSALSEDPLVGQHSEDSTVSLRVASLSHVDAMCELKLHSDPSVSRRLADHEYVALMLPGKQQPYPAIVAGTAPVRAGAPGSTGGGPRSTLTLETMMRITLPSDSVRAIAIQRALRPGVVIPVRRICSLVTATRDYVALHSVAHIDSRILAMILAPQRVPDIEKVVPKTLSLPPLYGGEQGLPLNESQIRAVHAATMRASPLLMVQGPPGTGKTRMIEALVLAVLEKDRLARISTSPAEPGSVSGRGAGRVLVCAPSNAAVDELGRRLRRAANGVLRVVRVGASDAIAGDMLDLTLDALVERRVLLSGDNALEELQKRLSAAEAAGDVERVASLRRIIQTTERESDGAADSRARGKSQAARRQAMDDARMRILDEAQVVLCTLGSSGSDLMARGTFGTLVVDEACQCVELAVIAPLLLGARSIVLVGDPQQLPPTVLSQMATRYAYAQSLFVRVARGAPKGAVLMLDTQYRMHPELSRFPSAYFYGGRLLDGPDAAGRTHRPWHLTTAAPLVGLPQILRPLCFADVSVGTEATYGARPSVMNSAETAVVVSIVQALCSAAGAATPMAGRIAIVTPYREQRTAIRNELVRRLGGPRCVDVLPGPAKGQAKGPPIEVSTVDGFQGQERDIVIFSCVRTGAASGGIGFLADVRRLNVALTRARSSLIVVGRADALARASPVWRAFIEDVRRRGCILRDAADGEVWRPLHGSPAPSNLFKWPTL